MGIDLADITEVVIHPYRTKRANWLIAMEGEEPAAMVAYLAKQAGKTVDNHTTYEVKFKSGDTLYVSNIDHRITIGLSIRDF
jgi:hypothetical protein